MFGKTGLTGTHRLWLGVLAGLGVFAALIALNDAISGLSPREEVVAGQLRIAGSRSLQADVERWVAAYKRRHPGARIRVSLDGSGLAATALANDAADVAALSRELLPDERAYLAASRVYPAAVQVEPRPAGGNTAGRPRYIYLKFAKGRPPAQPAIDFTRLAIERERNGGRNLFAPVPGKDENDDAGS